MCLLSDRFIWIEQSDAHIMETQLVLATHFIEARGRIEIRRICALRQTCHPRVSQVTVPVKIGYHRICFPVFLARRLWHLLQPNEIQLADRGFCSYLDIALLLGRGVDCVSLERKKHPQFRIVTQPSETFG
jgi:hypothetical protein